jgi:hypothetical protein
MKLVHIRSSTKPTKKLMAVFDINGKKKTVHFGQKGADDYTITKNVNQRDHYLMRHRNHEDWNKPDTAGALSRWILWGPTISLEYNIDAFKSRFHL